MTFQEFKAAVIARAKALGVAEYELYYAAGESTEVGIFQHEVNAFSSSTEGGVSFRCLRDGKMGYASTQELSQAEAERLVDVALESAASLETDEQEFLGEGGREYRAVAPRNCPEMTAQELVKIALAAQEALYAADPAVIDGSESSAESFRSSVAIVNSRGLDLYHEYRNNVLYTSAVVSDGKEMEDAYEIRFGDLASLDLAQMTAKAAGDAKAHLGAEPAPTGAYLVVFSPKAMSTMLGTFASVFSAENVRRGLSLLRDKEGESIAAPCVTLTDDPFYPDNPNQMPFDAEGTPTYTKNVIEGGVLKTLLYNLKNAHLAGKETTGNASKGGYAGAVGISPFTMALQPGELTEAELLQKAGNGVYIDFLGGTHAGANPISGDFSLQSAGFLIENGVKTRPVKSFTVAGNFFSLLKGITALSDKAELPRFGSTAFASPSVLVEGLTVAGK